MTMKSSPTFHEVQCEENILKNIFHLLPFFAEPTKLEFAYLASYHSPPSETSQKGKGQQKANFSLLPTQWRRCHLETKQRKQIDGLNGTTIPHFQV